MFKKWLAQPRSKDLLIIAAIIFLNVLPRLIYIFNNSFFINGDEAIFGTMIRNSLVTGRVPLFFYGNHYLLVFFEVLLSAIISWFFGINIFSMKIAMLLFWLASIVTLYYIEKKIFASRRWAFLTVILVSFIPVWFDWATKASGGYLTALLFSNIIILLALFPRNRGGIISISLSALVIYYSQPLWLIVTAPFILYYFLKDFKLKYSVLFVISSLTSLLIFHGFLIYIGFNYQVQNKLGLSQLGRNIKNIFGYYATAYSGRFFDSAPLRIEQVSLVNSAIFLGLLVLVIIYDGYLIIKKRIKKNEALFLFSVIAYILFMLFYSEEIYSYRYLLPIFIPSAVLIILAIKRLSKPQLKEGLYIFLTIYTIFSLFCGIYSYNFVFPPINDGHTEVERIEYLGNFLHANNIKCVYTLDWIISQHINYFIPDMSVRHQEIDPRRPQDSVMVDSEQRSNECALVGLWYQVSSFTSLYKLKDIYIISNRYIVYLRPQREDLLRLNFKLTN